jgi:hypothetical protein
VEADAGQLAPQASDAALDAATSGWRYDAATKFLWVKLPAGGSTIVTAS